MRIKLHGRWAGPFHNYPAGSILDLPEVDARYFLESRQAEAVDPLPDPAPDKQVRADAPQETAIPAPKRRGRKPRVESAPPEQPITEPADEPDPPAEPSPLPPVDPTDPKLDF